MADKNHEVFEIEVKAGNRIGRRLASTIGNVTQNVVRGANSGRRTIGAANEPFDPNALDGDGDMLIQDGSIWERPVVARGQIGNPMKLEDSTGEPTGGTRSESRRRKRERPRDTRAPEQPQPSTRGALSTSTTPQGPLPDPDHPDFWRMATIEQIVEAAVPSNEKDWEKSWLNAVVGDRDQYESQQEYDMAVEGAKKFHEYVRRHEVSSYNTLQTLYDDEFGAGAFAADANNPKQAQERMREMFGSQTAFLMLISSPQAAIIQTAFLSQLSQAPGVPQNIKSYASAVLSQVDMNPNSPNHGKVQLPEIFGNEWVNPLEAMIATAITGARTLNFQNRVPAGRNLIAADIRDMLDNPSSISGTRATMLAALLSHYFSFAEVMQSIERPVIQSMGLDLHKPLTKDQVENRILYVLRHMDARAGANGMLLPNKNVRIFQGQHMNLLGVPSFERADVEHVRDVLRRALTNNPEFLAAVRVVGLPAIAKTHRMLEKHIHMGSDTDTVPDSILDGTATPLEKQRWNAILQQRENVRMGKQGTNLTREQQLLHRFDSVPDYLGGYTAASGWYTFEAGLLFLEGSMLGYEATRDPRNTDFVQGRFKFSNLDSVEVAGDEGLVIHEFGHYLHNMIVVALEQALTELMVLLEDENSDFYKQTFPNATQQSPASWADKEQAIYKLAEKVISAGGTFGGHVPTPEALAHFQQNPDEIGTVLRKVAMMTMASSLPGAVPGVDVTSAFGRRLFDWSSMSENEIVAKFDELLDIVRVINQDKSLMQQRVASQQQYATDAMRGLPRDVRRQRHTDRIKAIRDAAQGSQEPYVNTDYGNTNEHERFAEITLGVLAENSQKRPLLVNDAAVQLLARILGLDIELNMDAMEVSRQDRQGNVIDATHLVTSTIRAVSPELKRQTHGHRPTLDGRAAQSRSAMLRFDPDERSRGVASRSNIGLDTDSRLYAYNEPIGVMYKRSGTAVYVIGDHHFYINKRGYPSQTEREITGFNATLRYLDRSAPHHGDAVRFISSTLFGLFLDDMGVYDTTTEWDKTMLRGLVAGEIADMSPEHRELVEAALVDAIDITNAIQDAKPTTRELQRHLPYDPDFFGRYMIEGEEFPMPISAMSTENVGNIGGVVLHVLPGAKAVEGVSKLYLTAGTFEVVSKRMDGNTLHVELRHKETMDMKHEAMRPVDPLLDTPENMRKLGKYGPRYTVDEARRMQMDRDRRVNQQGQYDSFKQRALASRSGGMDGTDEVIGEWVDGQYITPWMRDHEIETLSQGNARDRLREKYPDWEKMHLAHADRLVESLLDDTGNDRDGVRWKRLGTQIMSFVLKGTQKRLSRAKEVFDEKYAGATPWLDDGPALRALTAMGEPYLKRMSKTLHDVLLDAFNTKRFYKKDANGEIELLTQNAADATHSWLVSDSGESARGQRMTFNSTVLRHLLATGELLLEDRGMSTETDRNTERRKRVYVDAILNPQTADEKALREYLETLLRGVEAIERAYLLDGSYRNRARQRTDQQHDLRGVVTLGGQRLLFNSRYRPFDESGNYYGEEWSEGPQHGVKITVPVNRNEVQPSMSISVKASIWTLDRNNTIDTQVGSFERKITVNPVNHRLEVEHKTFFLGEPFGKNSGLATLGNQHAWQWLRQAEGTSIRVRTANDGPIVWPRTGFTPIGRINWHDVLDALKIALLLSDDSENETISRSVANTMIGNGTAWIRDIEPALRKLLGGDGQGPESAAMRRRVAMFIKIVELDMKRRQLDGVRPMSRHVPTSRFVMLANILSPRTFSREQNEAWLMLFRRIYSDELTFLGTLDQDRNDNDFLPSFVIDSDATNRTEVIKSDVVGEALDGSRPSEVERDMLLPQPQITDGRGPQFPTMSREQASRLNQVLGMLGENAAPSSPRDDDSTGATRIAPEPIDGSSMIMMDTLEAAQEAAGFNGPPRLMTRDELLGHQGAQISYSVIPDQNMVMRVGDDESVTQSPSRESPRGNRLQESEARENNVSKFLAGTDPYPSLQLVATENPATQIYHLVDGGVRLVGTDESGNPASITVPTEPSTNPYGVVSVSTSWTRSTTSEELRDIAERVLGGPEKETGYLGRYSLIRQGIGTDTFADLADDILEALFDDGSRDPELTPAVQIRREASGTYLNVASIEDVVRRLYEQDRNEAIRDHRFTDEPIGAEPFIYSTRYQATNEDNLPSRKWRTVEGFYRIVNALAAINNQEIMARIEGDETLLDAYDAISYGMVHLALRVSAGDPLAEQTLAVLLGFDEIRHVGVSRRTLRSFRDTARRGDRTLGGREGKTILNRNSRVFMDEPVSIREASLIADALERPMRGANYDAIDLVRTVMNRPNEWTIRPRWHTDDEGQEFRASSDPLDISIRGARSASFIRAVRQDWGTDIRQEPRGARSTSDKRRLRAREDMRYGAIRWTSTEQEFKDLLTDLVKRYNELQETLDKYDEAVDNIDDDNDLPASDYELFDKIDEITVKQQDIEDQIAALVNTSNRAMTAAVELDASIASIDEAIEILQQAGVGAAPEGFIERIQALREDFVRRRENYDLADAKRRHKILSELLEDEFDINWGVQHSKGVEPVYLDDFDDFDREWQQETTTRYLVEGFINPDFDEYSGIYAELDSTRREWRAVFEGMTRERREEFKRNHDRHLRDSEETDPDYEEDIISATRPSSTTRPNQVPVDVWRKVRSIVARARRTEFDGERTAAYEAAKRLLRKHRPELATDEYVRGLRSNSGTPEQLIRSRGANMSSPTMRGSDPTRPSVPVEKRPLMRLVEKARALGVSIELEDITRDLTLPSGLSEEMKEERSATKRAFRNGMVVKALREYRKALPESLEKIETEIANESQRGRSVSSDLRTQRAAIKMAMAIVEIMREDGMEVMPLEGHATKKVIGPIDTDLADVLMDDIDIAMIRTQGSPTFDQLMDVWAFMRAERLRLHRMFGGKDSTDEGVFDSVTNAFYQTLKRDGQREFDHTVFRDASGNEVARRPLGDVEDNPGGLDRRGTGTLADVIDRLQFDRVPNVNDAIYHGMLEIMGLSSEFQDRAKGQSSSDGNGVTYAPLARMRLQLKSAENIVEFHEFAATPAGDYVRGLMKREVDKMRMQIEIVERLAARHIHIMREHGLKDKDIIALLEISAQVNSDIGSNVKQYKGIVPTLGDDGGALQSAVVGYTKMKFEERLLPSIGNFSVRDLLTHEIGHAVLGQAFTRHGEFGANLWPYAIYGDAFYGDFVRIQRNQETFDTITLHEHLGLVMTPEQRAHYERGMDLGLKRAVSDSANVIGLNKRVRPITPRHQTMIRDAIVERIMADSSLSDSDKNLLVRQIDSEIEKGRFIIRPRLSDRYKVAPGNPPIIDKFTEQEKEDLRKIGLDPESLDYQYESSETTSLLWQAYDKNIPIPPRLFGWQRTSADTRGARSASDIVRAAKAFRDSLQKSKDEKEMLRMAKEGMNGRRIARELGYHPQEVKRILTRFVKNGELDKIPQGKKGREAVQTNKHRARVLELAKQGFTATQIATEIGGVSRRTVERIMEGLVKDGELNQIPKGKRGVSSRAARSSSLAPKTRVTQEKITEGPQRLIYGRDAQGVPIVGTTQQNKSRYGSTRKEVKSYFKKNHGIRLRVPKSMFDEKGNPEFVAGGYGALQALDELLMNVPGFKKLSKDNDIEFVLDDGGAFGRMGLERERMVMGSFGPVPNLFRSFGFAEGERTRTKYTINLHNISWKTEDFVNTHFGYDHRKGRLMTTPKIVSDILSLYEMPSYSEDLLKPEDRSKPRKPWEAAPREYRPEAIQEIRNIVASRTAYGTAIHEFAHFLDYSMRDPSANPRLRMPSKVRLLFDTYISRRYENLTDEQGNPRKPTAEDLFGGSPSGTYESASRAEQIAGMPQVSRYGASATVESLAEAWAAWWLFARAPDIRVHPQPFFGENLTPEEFMARDRAISPVATNISDIAAPIIRPLLEALGRNVKSAQLSSGIIGSTMEPLITLFVLLPFYKQKTKKRKKK